MSISIKLPYGEFFVPDRRACMTASLWWSVNEKYNMGLPPDHQGWTTIISLMLAGF